MRSESSPAPLPPPGDLAEVVERSVVACPDAVAVTSGDAAMTYAELDVAANRLAHHLLASGVTSDTPVGICAERTLAMPVGLLAILKAGGTCLPLDPSYPAERLRVMLADAAPPVVLAQPGPAELIESARSPATGIVDLDGGCRANTTDRPVRQRDPGRAAYLIYTSGSTGEPRGVLLPHRALVNHCLAAVELYDLEPADRVLQFCSPSFDVSIEELFPTWAAGARVVLRPRELAILGRPWLDWLDAERITVLNLPTAYWHAWVRDLDALGAQPPAGLRVVIVGGERATAAAYRSWQRVGGDRIRWFNAYGPTEAGVMATIHHAPPGSMAGDGDPPIGRPLPGVTVHVLDSDGRPAPDGETGELHIGGVGLARGYLNQPELTAERFVLDPAAGDEGRLYRTGDLVRVRPDGELEFVGRRDRQVKVSGGFRVEPGEVEVALRSHPGVTDAVVSADEDPPGQRRLVGYVVTAPGATVLAAGLRRHLSARLPAYLVPASIVTLSEFPMTPNGKVDHVALASLRRRQPDPGQVATPRTSVERAVAAIWSTVLGLGDVGTTDDLFESGGDSLRAAQIAASIQEAFGTPVPLSTLLAEPTVAALARYLEAEGARPGADAPSLVAARRRPGTPVPLSLPQEQMWQLETASGPIANQNVTACRHLPEPVDEEVLRAALRALVERHEILRTRFSVHDSGPCQHAVAAVPVDLATIDLSAGRDGEWDNHVARQDWQRFDLDRAPLFRARLYRLDARRCVLAVTFDHLICDGPSAYIFLSELAATYRAVAVGATPQLRPLAVQYADFAEWQRRWLTEDRLSDQLDYWRQTLAGAPPGPALPFDRIPAEPARRLRSLPVRVGRATYESLSELARRSQASVFMLCVAAVSALLSRLGDTSDIVLSTTLSGRRRAELEGVIGTFAGTGRIRTDLSGDPSFTATMARAREAVIGLFEHQDIPFSRVREAVLPDLSRPDGTGPRLALLPVDLQYFRAAHDHWVPGTGVVERPGPDKGPDELYFRGQLHPLSITLLDDGTELWGEVVYKQDFYDEATAELLADGLHRLLEAVLVDPDQRLSTIPLP